MLIGYIRMGSRKSSRELMVKYGLVVEGCELGESRIVEIGGWKSFIKGCWWKKM